MQTDLRGIDLDGLIAARSKVVVVEDDSIGPDAIDEYLKPIASRLSVPILNQDNGPLNRLAARNAIRHHIVFPPGGVLPPPDSPCFLSPPPAKLIDFGFKLDRFQLIACSAVDRCEPVLVAAHTSAGKTVVAEHAIQLALNKHQRVVYTSPIKALSNQKFHDLCERFGNENVGLMTGDVTTRRDALCVVVTTEILRSMLYRGDTMTNEVGCVIFDEVHYMRDDERGVVWEETITQLAAMKVSLVFLSATIPNADEFAGWIARVHGRMCHVVYTQFRPVPLRHYIVTQGHPKPALVLDARGNWNAERFNKATCKLGAAQERPGPGIRDTAKHGMDDAAGMNLLVKTVSACLALDDTSKTSMAPIIVFSFSRQEVEKIATTLFDSIRQPLNSVTEGKTVDLLFESGLSAVFKSDEDRDLPELSMVRRLVKYGIGVHHAGLLPVVKEVVEFAFLSGLIKVLVATETFALGVNMPANTVIFSDITKWDGQQRRELLGSEYIQMAGRAGRRLSERAPDGTLVEKDNHGVVIVLIHDAIDPAVAQNVMSGDSAPLLSSYRLSYHMILNQLMMNQDPAASLRHSFLEYQRLEQRARLALEYKDLNVRHKQLCETQESDLQQQVKTGTTWVARRRQQTTLRAKYTRLMFTPTAARTWLAVQDNRPRFVMIGPVTLAGDAQRNDHLQAGQARLWETNTSVGVDVRTAEVAKEDVPPLGWALSLGMESDPGATDESLDGHWIRVIVPIRIASGPTKERSPDESELARMYGNSAQIGIHVCEPGGFSPWCKNSHPLEMRIPLAALWDISRVRGTTIEGRTTFAHMKNIVMRSIASLGKVRASSSDIPQTLDDWIAVGPRALPCYSLQHIGAEFAEIHARDKEITGVQKAMGMIEDSLQRHPLQKMDTDRRIAALEKVLPLLTLEARMKAIIDRLQTDLSDTAMERELEARKGVLQGMGFIDEMDRTTSKGKATAQISAADELIVGELVCANMHEGLSNEEFAGTLAALAGDPPRKTKGGKGGRGPQLSEGVMKALEQLGNIATRVGTESVARGVPGVTPMQLQDSINSEAAGVAFDWVRGCTIGQIIAARQDLYPGQVVRTLRRLGELIRQIGDAASSLGSETLLHRCQTLMEIVTRGLVGSSSLYLTETM